MAAKDLRKKRHSRCQPTVRGVAFSSPALLWHTTQRVVIGLNPPPSTSTKIGFATAPGGRPHARGPSPGRASTSRRSPPRYVSIPFQPERDLLVELHGRIRERSVEIWRVKLSASAGRPLRRPAPGRRRTSSGMHPDFERRLPPGAERSSPGIAVACDLAGAKFASRNGPLDMTSRPRRRRGPHRAS